MFKICTFLVLLVVHLSDQTCTTPIKVTILYEALCTDSVNFISNQLAKNYEQIKSSVDIEFVPFGKAEYEFDKKKYHFTCHFYERECTLNKFHACGLKYAPSQTDRVKFVNCMMTQASAKTITNTALRDKEDLNILEKCSLSANIPKSDVNLCRTSLEGEKLLADHGDRTKEFRSIIPTNKYDVPIIIFKENYDQQLQDRIRHFSQFLNVVDELCSNQVPSVCWYCVPGQSYANPYSQYTYGGAYAGYGMQPYYGGYSYPCSNYYPCNNYYQPFAY